MASYLKSPVRSKTDGFETDKPADKPTVTSIGLDARNRDWPADIRRRSGTDIQSCLHCLSCASGCPFIAAMDYLPNQVIRLAQLGMRRQALSCATIWTCVGCHTCSAQCPMAIDMAAFMDALRQTAMAEGVPPAEPGVLAFHQEVLGSIRRYGRTHKLEIMLRYKMKSRDWFSDINLGLRMMARRKLDLMPSKVADMEKLRPLFENGAGKGGIPHA